MTLLPLAEFVDDDDWSEFRKSRFFASCLLLLLLVDDEAVERVLLPPAVAVVVAVAVAVAVQSVQVDEERCADGGDTTEPGSAVVVPFSETTGDDDDSVLEASLESVQLAVKLSSRDECGDRGVQDGDEVWSGVAQQSELGTTDPATRAREGPVGDFSAMTESGQTSEERVTIPFSHLK